MRVEILTRRYFVLLVGTSTPVEYEFTIERKHLDDGAVEDTILLCEFITKSETLH